MSMKLEDLKNKRIGMLGLGVENYALVKYLLKHKVTPHITVYDTRRKKALGERCGKLAGKVDFKLGQDLTLDLNLDILFRSPGWPRFCPLVKKMTASGALLYSPVRLFFDLCPSGNIIGVTGTKGKGTTASLIFKILKQAGKRGFLGGNIGIAPFDFLGKIKKNDWVVLELSSFQLEDMEASPRMAVITNFTPEHLSPADPNNPNYHPSLADYKKSKANIFKYQFQGDSTVANPKLKWIKTKGKLFYFEKSSLSSRLLGGHNRENIGAAVLAARLAGARGADIARAVRNFRGLPHRIEPVREVDGVKYYDDSFATTPEATITALESFDMPVILLVGGADKSSDFKKLAREIKKRVKFAVLLDGKATPRIKKELLLAGYPASRMKLVYNIRDAVREAKKRSVAGDAVLLSTACASFGMFKNYKERGEQFKKQITNRR